MEYCNETWANLDKYENRKLYNMMMEKCILFEIEKLL